jgi:hypothetical protein
MRTKNNIFSQNKCYFYVSDLSFIEDIQKMKREYPRLSKPSNWTLKLADHGADSVILLPGHMQNRLLYFLSLWRQQKVDLDLFWGEQKYPTFHVFTSLHSPKSSLSIALSIPICPHQLIVALDGWCSTDNLAACKWQPIIITSQLHLVSPAGCHFASCHCSHGFVVVVLLPWSYRQAIVIVAIGSIIIGISFIVVVIVANVAAAVVVIGILVIVSGVVSHEV